MAAVPLGLAIALPALRLSGLYLGLATFAFGIIVYQLVILQTRPLQGSFLGKAHQRFEDLKAAVTGKDEQAIINEVERGEDYLKDKFETALNSGHLSGDSRAVVERAYQSVRKGHDQVSSLKHGLEA